MVKSASEMADELGRTNADEVKDVKDLKRKAKGGAPKTEAPKTETETPKKETPKKETSADPNKPIKVRRTKEYLVGKDGNLGGEYLVPNVDDANARTAQEVANKQKKKDNKEMHEAHQGTISPRQKKRLNQIEHGVNFNNNKKKGSEEKTTRGFNMRVSSGNKDTINDVPSNHPEFDPQRPAGYVGEEKLKSGVRTQADIEAELQAKKDKIAEQTAKIAQEKAQKKAQAEEEKNKQAGKEIDTLNKQMSLPGFQEIQVRGESLTNEFDTNYEEGRSTMIDSLRELYDLDSKYKDPRKWNASIIKKFASALFNYKAGRFIALKSKEMQGRLKVIRSNIHDTLLLDDPGEDLDIKDEGGNSTGKRRLSEIPLDKLRYDLDKIEKEWKELTEGESIKGMPTRSDSPQYIIESLDKLRKTGPWAKLASRGESGATAEPVDETASDPMEIYEKYESMSDDERRALSLDELSKMSQDLSSFLESKENEIRANLKAKGYDYRNLDMYTSTPLKEWRNVKDIVEDINERIKAKGEEPPVEETPVEEEEGEDEDWALRPYYDIYLKYDNIPTWEEVEALPIDELKEMANASSILLKDAKEKLRGYVDALGYNLDDYDYDKENLQDILGDDDKLSDLQWEYLDYKNAVEDLSDFIEWDDEDEDEEEDEEEGPVEEEEVPTEDVGLEGYVANTDSDEENMKRLRLIQSDIKDLSKSELEERLPLLNRYRDRLRYMFEDYLHDAGYDNKNIAHEDDPNWVKYRDGLNDVEAKIKETRSALDKANGIEPPESVLDGLGLSEYEPYDESQIRPMKSTEAYNRYKTVAKKRNALRELLMSRTKSRDISGEMRKRLQDTLNAMEGEIKTLSRHLIYTAEDDTKDTKKSGGNMEQPEADLMDEGGVPSFKAIYEKKISMEDSKRGYTPAFANMKSIKPYMVGSKPVSFGEGKQWNEIEPTNIKSDNEGTFRRIHKGANTLDTSIRDMRAQ